jgi:hypothetical protein
MFMATVNAWTCNSSNQCSWGSSGYDASAGSTAGMRALAEWLIMARYTGFWTLAPTMAQQVMKELISQASSSITAGNGFAPETQGEFLLAFDPRGPGWF